MSANKNMMRLLAALLLASPLTSAELRFKQLDRTENLTMNGGTVTGLPTPSSPSDAATKQFVDDNTGVTTENLRVTEFATSITPQGADVVNLLGSFSALPADVMLSNTFQEQLDAEFAVGTDTHTVEFGSPTITGFRLDLTEGGSTVENSAISYDATGNAGLAAGAIRIMFVPNWSGTTIPDLTASELLALTKIANNDTFPCTFQANDADCESTAWMVVGNDSTVYAAVYDGNGNEIGFLNTPVVNWVQDQTYEIELNWDTGGTVDLYIDGTREATKSAVNTVAPQDGERSKIFVGGGVELGLSPAGNSSIGASNHYIEGIQFFDSAQHTGASYTPTGLDGSSTNTDVLSTIVSTSYEEGDVLSLVARDPGRYEVTDTTAPSTDEVQANGDWVPATVGDRLELRYSGVFWTEIGRSPQPGNDLNGLVITGAATSITPPNASQQTTLALTGSAQSYPADIDFTVTFDGTTTADHAGGTDTATTEAGTPVVNQQTSGGKGGSLEMHGDTAEGISYPRDGGNFSDPNDCTIRLIARFDYSGTPTNDQTLFKAGNDTTTRNNQIEIMHLNDGNLWVVVEDQSSNSTTVSPAFSPVAGRAYEIEVNIRHNGGSDLDLYLYIDGVNEAQQEGALLLTQNTPAGSKIFLGGISGANTDADGNESRGRSDFSIEGMQIFNAIQHTGDDYTAVGLEYEGVTETIDTIVSTGFRAGDTLTLRPNTPNRFTFDSVFAPGDDGLRLSQDWTPGSVFDWLKLQYTGRYWQEVGRSPVTVAPYPTTNQAVARFSGIGGQLQDSNVLINNSDLIQTPGGVSVTGGTVDVNGVNYNDAASTFGDPALNMVYRVGSSRIYAVQSSAGTNVMAYFDTSGGIILRPDTSSGGTITLQGDGGSAQLRVQGTAPFVRVFNDGRVDAEWDVDRHALGVPTTLTLGAAATTMDPDDDAGSVEVTSDAGNNSIDTITGTGFTEGDQLKITVGTLPGTLTFVDTGSPTTDQLALDTNAVMTLDSVLLLEYTGTYWREISRSLN